MTKNLGQKINFNFEVEKDAIVAMNSCGAWFNGEYHIITGEINKRDLRTIRKVDIVHLESGLSYLNLKQTQFQTNK